MIKINQRIEIIEQRLTMLGKKLRMQLSLMPAQRDHALLHFLRQESNLYTAIHQELTQLSEPDSPPLDDRNLYGNPLQILSSKNLLTQNTKQISIDIDGGLGDVLCITPTLRVLKQQFPALNIYLNIPNKIYASLFDNNPHIESCYLPKEHTQSDIALSVGGMGTDVHYRHHASQILAGAFNLVIDDVKPDLFISQQERSDALSITKTINAKLVTLSTTSRSPANQDWPIQRWQQLIALHPDITFAQIGLPDEPRVEGSLDWRSKGQLRETVALLQQADAHVGMDTFWSHASSAVDTPAVILFAGTHPSVFSYPEHIALYKNYRCSPCHHTLRGRHCPYDTECLTAITVKEVSQALQQQLSL